VRTNGPGDFWMSSATWPFAQSGGQLLFHLISRLYERTSILLTTNLAFGEWPSVFYKPSDWLTVDERVPGEAAVIDLFQISAVKV
jgi:hypothetical protein